MREASLSTFLLLTLTGRLAEFVTKAIDNVNHGLTVNRAVEKLGLQR